MSKHSRTYIVGHTGLSGSPLDCFPTGRLYSVGKGFFGYLIRKGFFGSCGEVDFISQRDSAVL